MPLVSRPTLAALGAALLLGPLLTALPAEAALLTENGTLVFSGSLRSDDEVALHEFDLVAPLPLNVGLETFSYAGGPLRDGTTVPAGGFDPVLSLFTSAGELIGFGDDGLRRKDPVSGDPYDAFLNLSLVPGTYLLALTQYDNYPNAPLGGFLAAGFSREGQGNFTGGPCGASSFCDSGGFSRTPDYVVQVSTLAEVPLPAGMALLLGALGMIGALELKRQWGA